MTPFGQRRPSVWRSLVRDVFVLVLAEAFVLGLAWCLSVQGRAALARLFRAKRAGPGTAGDAAEGAAWRMGGAGARTNRPDADDHPSGTILVGRAGAHPYQFNTIDV